MKFIILLLRLACLLRHSLSENIDEKSSGNATAAGGPDAVKEEPISTDGDDTPKDPVEDLNSIDNEQSGTDKDPEDPIEDETSEDIVKLMEVKSSGNVLRQLNYFIPGSGGYSGKTGR